ncbi:MAG: hypothetical protein ACK5M3_04645 [Dysgonomonas sp.]
MKKLLLLLLLLPSLSFAQLPYSKMLSYDENKLKESKFKYDKGKNQYILNKSNGLNNVSNVFSAIGGTTADIRPHSEDYRIIIQYGETGVSSLQAIFYDDNAFLNIQNWLTENNINFIESTTGKKMIQTFDYDNYKVEVYVEKVGISTTTGRTTSLAKSIDESYNIYSYMINTGIPPSSKWHEKEAAKKAKADAKGKKKDIEDLF